MASSRPPGPSQGSTGTRDDSGRFRTLRRRPLPCLLGSPARGSRVGCRRGATSSQISSAINDACRKIGRSSQSIAILASSIVKQEEIGLLAVVDQLEIPVKFYTNEELQDIIEVYRLGQSKFVLEEIGVGNVCEASALLGGRASNLLLDKTVYPKVTVAIAEVKLRWWESDPAMA